MLLLLMLLLLATLRLGRRVGELATAIGGLPLVAASPLLEARRPAIERVEARLPWLQLALQES